MKNFNAFDRRRFLGNVTHTRPGTHAFRLPGAVWKAGQQDQHTKTHGPTGAGKTTDCMNVCVRARSGLRHRLADFLVERAHHQGPFFMPGQGFILLRFVDGFFEHLSPARVPSFLTHRHLRPHNKNQVIEALFCLVVVLLFVMSQLSPMTGCHLLRRLSRTKAALEQTDPPTPTNLLSFLQS
jgi:hypothetical protein